MANLWEPINGIYTATAPLLPWAPGLVSIELGDFWSSLISAGIGAGFGAWMAGRIARKHKLRDELLAELRSIDVATTLCGSVIDIFGGLKKQHISGMLKKYHSDLARFARYKSDRNRTVPFILAINNIKFQTIAPPISELQELVLKNISISPNGVKSMTALAEAAVNLNGMIEAYNALLEMFKHGGLPPGFTPEDYYLANPVGGVANNEFGSALQGIATYTDDIIFFAMKLCGCLTSRGVKVRDHFEKLSGERLQVRRIDLFEGDAGLIPPDSAYGDWLRGWEKDFGEAANKRRWWQRKQ